MAGVCAFKTLANGVISGSLSWAVSLCSSYQLRKCCGVRHAISCHAKLILFLLLQIISCSLSLETCFHGSFFVCTAVIRVCFLFAYTGFIQVAITAIANLMARHMHSDPPVTHFSLEDVSRAPFPIRLCCTVSWHVFNPVSVFVDENGCFAFNNMLN